MTNRKFKFSVLFSLLLSAVLITGTALAGGSSTWPSAGHDIFNSRNQSQESKISPANVGSLAVRWQFTTEGDVSATPAVDGSTVYFPDWRGFLYAVDENTGVLVWKHSISEYTGVAGDYARATPAIVGNLLILGDQGGYVNGSGARLFAVNKTTGAPVWTTMVESHPFAIITQSALVDANGTTNIAYVGVASAEELFAAFIPNYPCCSFRGSFLAVNASTGQILWKTYTVPSGYSGGSVWGSTAAIDHSRSSIYITTGNNYSVPQSVNDCAAAGTPIQDCLSPDDHFDSILSLNINTGAINWATRALNYDAWNVACIPGFNQFNPAACPSPAGPDYDFGQGPALFTIKPASSNKSIDVVGAGQKSGKYWALNRDTGAVLWMTQVGPGGTAGGLQWGSAYDGQRIYVADANSGAQPWNLVQNGQATGTVVTSGFWSALDPATGMILWQTADPGGAQVPAPMSVANGVVYGCSLDSVGHMYAFDAASGAIKWSFASGGSCNAGAADVSGTVFWGSGYSNLGFGTPNNKFYAFYLP